MPANLMAFCTAIALIGTSTHATEPLAYQLSWNDEFNGTSLNTNDWWYRADEKQQSIQLPSNVEVQGGELILNLTPLATPINGFNAAGAGIISQQRFQYGYYETRSKLGDGIDHDNDGKIDEGWHHAFWAQYAEGDGNGNVGTTFPPQRRTEIDGYENGSSGNIGRMSQHVLVWNDQGVITEKIPSSDITINPPGTEFDWHTYGFEWTPQEVRFYVDDVLTKVAVYPADQYEHSEGINLWLTAISTNAEANNGPGQELSEARYDYFRFYEKGAISVASGETLTAGVQQDLVILAGQGTDGVAGDITVQSGGTVDGAGWIYGDTVVQSGGVMRIGTAASGAAPSAAPVTTSEDFESYTPGTAFTAGASTGLTPDWAYYDLGDPGESFTDTVWQISGADGTASEPLDAALTGESQMLFQTNPDIDFSLDPQNSPFAGAIAVNTTLDTSGAADIIDVDFVFDGYGDNGNQNLDTKLVFGFQDVDNWFALSLVRGSSGNTGANQIQLSANVGGDRQTVASTGGTVDFAGFFEQDTLLHAQIQHDATLGYVAYTITDPLTGTILAQDSALDDRFKFDGDVGVAVNNDVTGIDNLTVTTQDALIFPEIMQDLIIDGTYTQLAGSTLEIDLLAPGAHDLLDVNGAATLDGGLAINSLVELALGERATIMTSEGLTGVFDNSQITGTALTGTPNTALALLYLDNGTDSDADLDDVVLMATYQGDNNGDGVVGPADLTELKLSWLASNATWVNGDYNYDGTVGPADLTALKLNWLSDLGLGAVPTPEPASALLLVLGGSALLRRSRTLK